MPTDSESLSLWPDIQECIRLLDVALRECKSRGDAMVKAEAEYYTAKAMAMFEMKQEGWPVTFIDGCIKGDPRVCEAMTAFHAAQVEYENAKEARNVYKKKLDTLREQYAREWGSSKE